MTSDANTPSNTQSDKAEIAAPPTLPVLPYPSCHQGLSTRSSDRGSQRTHRLAPVPTLLPTQAWSCFGNHRRLRRAASHGAGSAGSPVVFHVCSQVQSTSFLPPQIGQELGAAPFMGCWVQAGSGRLPRRCAVRPALLVQYLALRSVVLE